ncbi:MAG: hypothetical protein KA792_05710 [Bacteroidales bacterium]|nr:hypothetical protein [Bacteroidales bacterium]
MNITQEQINELSLILNLNITEADYAEKFEKKLKELKKKANMKGFRPGMVPMDLIKKLYGKEVLAEEIDKLINDGLNNYIKENKINSFYTPLAIDDDKEEIDLLLQKEFNFKFEIGYYNDFEINIEDLEVLKYDIEVDDKMVDDEINKLRKRFGKEIEIEIADEESSVKVLIQELDENNNVVEQGISNSVFLSFENLKRINLDNLFNKLLGTKKDDVVIINIEDLGHNHSFIENTLSTNHDKVHHFIDNKTNFNLTINYVKKMEPASLDIDFFQRVFPNENINDEAGLRSRFFELLKKELEYLSQNNFEIAINKVIIDKYKIDLPVDFIKRVLKKNNEENEKADKGDVDKNIENYLTFIREDLIKNEVAKKYNIKVEMDDIKEYSKKVTKQRIISYGLSLESVPEDYINSMAEELLKDEKNLKKTVQEASEDKIMEFIKSKVKINLQPISFEEFKNLKN